MCWSWQGPLSSCLHRGFESLSLKARPPPGARLQTPKPSKREANGPCEVGLRTTGGVGDSYCMASLWTRTVLYADLWIDSIDFIELHSYQITDYRTITRHCIQALRRKLCVLGILELNAYCDSKIRAAPLERTSISST